MELKKTFVNGSMNKDFDVRLIPEGEYIDAQNILITNSNDSSVGLIQKANGFEKLTKLSIPTDAITIGSVTDEGNECIYWFVTSSIGNFIYEYDVLNNESTSIILSDNRISGENVLNFNSEYKITGVNVIYNSFNKEKLLIWTDDLNPVRCININRSKTLSVNEFNSQDISLYKRAPFEAPTCTPTQFGDGTENNIKERFFSFGSRYKYLDGEYSATSAFSNPQFYPSDFSFNFSTQENNGMTNSFNAVNIKFNTGDKNVTDVQLLFKESNSNNIYIIDNFNKSKEGYGNNANKTFLFSNNKIYSILPDDEVNRLYDNVPTTAKAQEFIGNRLIFGNYTEGRNLIDADKKNINVDFETSFISSDLIENSLPVTLSSVDTVENVLNITILKDDLKKGNIISISFRASSPSPYFGTYLCDLSYFLEESFETAYDLSISDSFINFINVVATANFKNANLSNTNPENDVASYDNKFKPFSLSISSSENILRIKIPYIEHQIDTTPLITSDSLFTYENEYYSVKKDTVSVFSSIGNVYSSCKSNTSYEVGIVYLDEDGRYSTVITSKYNTVFVPIKNSAFTNRLKIKVKSKAPYWANRYKFFIKDSKLNYYTIYGVIAYEENGFLWMKLEGQDKQKVKEGDYLIVKKSINGYSEEVNKLQILEYSVKEKDFIKDNKNPSDKDIIEPAGVYIKLKSSSDLNIDSIEKNFYDLEKTSCDTGDNFYLFAGSETGFSTNIGTKTAPIVQDIPIPPGTIINISITNNRTTDKTIEFKKEYISSDQYDNFQSWFETEASGLGEFDDPENGISFVRGFTTPYENGGGWTKLPSRGENITLDPNGYLYLKIKNVLDGSAQKRSFLSSKITITSGFSLLIFETDPKDNDSEVFFETQDTYLIQNGNHLSRKEDSILDIDQTSATDAEIILNWSNCFCQGNGAESYIVKDVFNKNFLSTNSRPNSVQIDGYKEVRNIASLTYSGAFDKTTSYNSLNEFNLSRGNYKDLDDKYGSIQKIHSRDNDLIVFQEDKVHRVLYNKNVLTDAVGGGQISSIEEVLGQEVPFSGEWGISKNPESFAYYANSLYFADTNKGAVLRLGGDGLEPVSRYKMKDWFRDNLRDYKLNFKPAGFDPVRDEYILSLSNEEKLFVSSLVCGQHIDWINIKPNTFYTYNVDLGVNIGNHVFNYVIETGSIFDFEFTINGVNSTFNDRTGSGILSIPKTSSTDNGTLIIYNRELNPGALSITNKCIVNPELEVVTLVVGDDTDIGLSMTNKYKWTNVSTSTSGFSSELDIFTSNGVARFDSNTGFEGANEIPYNNSSIRVSSIKGTGSFTSCNRIGYVVSDLDLDPQEILDLATYPLITEVDLENYIEFTFVKTGSQKLYLVWDYIDVKNCNVVSYEIDLCYSETSIDQACKCLSLQDYDENDYSTDYFIN